MPPPRLRKTEGKWNSSAGDTKINNRELEKYFTSFFKLRLLFLAAMDPRPLRRETAEDSELISHQVNGEHFMCWKEGLGDDRRGS